jgi:hypothetical protein
LKVDKKKVPRDSTKKFRINQPSLEGVGTILKDCNKFSVLEDKNGQRFLGYLEKVQE